MKSVLSEIAERFKLCARYDERGFRFEPQSWPNTPETVCMMNNAGADIVRRYANDREIEIGPFEDCISIYNVPHDILPFIPLFFREISEHGTYTVMRGMKTLGRVTYRGMPEQDKPNTIAVGVITDFISEESYIHIGFTVTYCGRPEWADEEGCPMDNPNEEIEDCGECRWFRETEEQE